MDKYKPLIGLKINVEFNGNVVNSYKIRKIQPTFESMEGRGSMFRCNVDWSKKDVAGAYPTMKFDEKTLDELLDKNLSICPFMPNLYYIIEKEDN